MTPEMIDILVQTGATAEQIAALWKADMAERERQRESKRVGNAERQQRFRDSHKQAGTKPKRYSNKRNALRAVTPPIEELHTPGSDISPDGENQNDTPRAANPFPKPDWADPQVWRDWLEVRRNKRCKNTTTAYAGFLADVARCADDEWPPGKLLEFAVTRSWASIHRPEDSRNGRQQHNNVRPIGGDQRSKLARAIDEGLDWLGSGTQAQVS